MFKLTGKNILILSPQPWGNLFVSKHHYALELSKNNTVWFLNSIGQKKYRKLVSVKLVEKNLYVIDYFYVFYGLNKLPYTFVALVNYIISKIVKNKIGKIDIVWSFEQTRFFNLNHFRAKYKIFHPVDYISGYPYFEKMVADSADIILSVSDEILKTINSSTPKIKINHGLSYPSSKIEVPFKPTLNSNKTNIAYVGNINLKYIDRENFLKIIQTNNNCDFHIIGPHIEAESNCKDALTFKDRLTSFSNVYFHGIIAQEYFIEFLKYFDIFFTCYDWVKNPERISNSHKLLQYLYSGKVTVTNYFSAYDDVSADLLIMLKSNEDIAEKIKSVAEHLDYHNSEYMVKRRRTFALQFTYGKNIQMIEKIINASISARK